MELSTIIRLKVIPPVGLRPNLFPSGALVYSEPDNSLYYAGGDDGDARATFIQLVNNSSFGGTVTSVDATSKSLIITGGPITRSGTITVDLKDIGVGAGTYGSSGQIPVVSVDTYGRLTKVSLVPVNVGGTVKSVSITSNTLEITGSPVNTTGTIKINLPATGVVAGSYGSGTSIPVISVDSYGRIISATTVGVEGAAGNINHDFTLVGTGTIASPLGTSLKSQLVLDSATNLIQNSNIIIGNNSAITGSINARNISIGSNCLTSFTTSLTTSDNVVIGNYALNSSSSYVDRNVVIGVNAAKSVTTASDSVVLGYNAGASLTNLDSSIIIGADVQNDLNYKAISSNIVIGNNAKGGASYNVIIGNGSFSNNGSSTFGVGIGTNNIVGDRAIAIGGGVISADSMATSIGYTSTSKVNSISIGAKASIVDTSPATSDGGISIGYNSKANTTSVAIGSNADASAGVFSAAVGANAISSHKYAFVIGASGSSGADYEFSIGSSTYPLGNASGTGVDSSASSGTASPLPATPAAYFRLRINGNIYKLPLYNA